MMWVAPAPHFDLTTFMFLKDIYYGDLEMFVKHNLINFLIEISVDQRTDRQGRVLRLGRRRGFRSLRQDGPQRHRVRGHAGEPHHPLRLHLFSSIFSGFFMC
jgi:hypothetical protein